MVVGEVVAPEPVALLHFSYGVAVCFRFQDYFTSGLGHAVQAQLTGSVQAEFSHLPCPLTNGNLFLGIFSPEPLPGQ